MTRTVTTCDICGCELSDAVMMVEKGCSLPMVFYRYRIMPNKTEVGEHMDVCSMCMWEFRKFVEAKIEPMEESQKQTFKERFKRLWESEDK